MNTPDFPNIIWMSVNLRAIGPEIGLVILLTGALVALAAGSLSG
jgi:hypothetical protein